MLELVALGGGYAKWRRKIGTRVQGDVLSPA